MLIGNHRHTLIVFIYWFLLRNAVKVFLVCWERICLFWLVPLSISLASILTTSQWASHVSVFHVGIPFIMTEALLFVENIGFFCFIIICTVWIKAYNIVFDTLWDLFVVRALKLQQLFSGGGNLFGQAAQINYIYGKTLQCNFLCWITSRQGSLLLTTFTDLYPWIFYMCSISEFLHLFVLWITQVPLLSYIHPAT